MNRIIILIETSREFGRQLLKGIARYSKLQTPWSFYHEPRGMKSAVPKLTKWKADGIIMRNSIISKKLIDLKLPTILVLHETKRVNHLPAVVTENHSIAKLAAEHLVNRTLKNFAFCGFENFIWSKEREKYFTSEIQNSGFKITVYKRPKRS